MEILNFKWPMAKENSLIYKKSKQYQQDIVDEALKQVNIVNNMKKKKKKKDTIVKFNSNYTEIELLPLNTKTSSNSSEERRRDSFLLYGYDDEFMINRESLKLNRKEYFENLRRLMQNNFAILLLFFLCALPVSVPFLFSKRK